MPRLPHPGGDKGTWGNVLNDFLNESHKSDGTLRDGIVTESKLESSIRDKLDMVDSGGVPDGAVTNTKIQDGAVSESKLASAVQTKLNQAVPTWITLSGRPSVVGAGSSSNAARAAINADHGVNIKDHGATGDGIVDDTTSIQSVLNAATNTTVRFPAGTYIVSDTLRIPYTCSVVFDNGCVVKAGNEIAGPVIQWGVENGTNANGLKVRDRTMTGPGLIDCNHLADTGVYLPSAMNSAIADVVVTNFNANGFVLGGDVNAPENSVEITLLRVKVDRDDQGAVPVGSYGVWFTAKTSDSVQRDVVVVGADICFRNDGSGNRIETCHGWGWYTGRLPSVIFDDNGFQNTYIDCEADSPTQYCFRMRALGWRIIGGWSFVNVLVADSTVSGVKIDQNNPSASITGHGFIGSDSLHRLAIDIDMAFSLPNAYFTAVGNIGFNVVTAKVSNNDALRKPIVASLHDGNANAALGIEAVANAVNYLAVKNANAGGVLSLEASSSSADNSVPVKLASKGSGIVSLNSNSSDVAQFAGVTNAVNHFFFYNAGSGGALGIQANGSDSNINFILQPKGQGAVIVYATAGQAPTLRADGADTNVDLNLASKGMGEVQANGIAIATKLTAAATLDFPSVGAQSQQDLSITVTGAETGDAVALGVPIDAVVAGIVYSAWVSAANLVTVRAQNFTASPIDPASGMFKATVVR